jgi:MFS family permease
MRSTIAQQSGYFHLVRRNAQFRNLWIGQIVSLLGDWFNLIASASLIAILTKSGLAVGGLFVVRMLAPFLVSPLAGVAADLYNRKHLLILADILRGITVFGFLLVREPTDIWLLYTLTAVQLGISGVFFPTRNAILPDIVGEDELGAANALSSATWSVMLAVGAALGGLVSGFWGIYPAFVIDALTFFVSAVFIWMIRYEGRPTAPKASTGLAAGMSEYLEGFIYLKENREILILVLLKAAMAISVSGAFQVAQVAVAEQVFVIGEGGGISLGVLYAVVGAGTGIGPILFRRFTGDRDQPMRIAIATSYFVTFAGLILISPLWNFGTVVFGTLLRAIGVGVNWVFSTQLLLQLLPNRVRGRVFSLEFALLTLGNATSAAIAGLVLDQTSLGISGLFLMMAIAIVIPGSLWSLRITLRK